MGEEEIIKSEWNGGTLTNIRLHDLKVELKMALSIRDLRQTLTALKEINHELYGFQKQKQKIDIRNTLTKLSDEVNEYTRARTRRPMMNIPPELMDSIESLRYTLDQVFHDSGLQTKVSEDAGDAF